MSDQFDDIITRFGDIQMEYLDDYCARLDVLKDRYYELEAVTKDCKLIATGSPDSAAAKARLATPKARALVKSLLREIPSVHTKSQRRNAPALIAAADDLLGERRVVLGDLCDGLRKPWWDNAELHRLEDEYHRTKTPAAKHALVQALLDAEHCAICLEICWGETTQTACGHVFHSRCLAQWTGNTCPLCRAVVGV